MLDTFQVGLAHNGFHFAADCAHHVSRLAYLGIEYLRFRRQDNADGSVDFVSGDKKLGTIIDTCEAEMKIVCREYAYYNHEYQYLSDCMLYTTQLQLHI